MIHVNVKTYGVEEDSIVSFYTKGSDMGKKIIELKKFSVGFKPPYFEYVRYALFI